MSAVEIEAQGIGRWILMKTKKGWFAKDPHDGCLMFYSVNYDDVIDFCVRNKNRV